MEEDNNKRRRNLVAFGSLVLASAFLGLDANSLIASALKISVPSQPWRLDLLVLATLIYLLYRYAMREDLQEDSASGSKKALLVKGWPDLSDFRSARNQVLQDVIARSIKSTLNAKVKQSTDRRSLPEPLSTQSAFDELYKSAGIRPEYQVQTWRFTAGVPDSANWANNLPPHADCSLVALTSEGFTCTGNYRMPINANSLSFRLLAGEATARTAALTSFAVDRLLPYYVGLAAAAAPAAKLCAAAAMALGL